MMMSKPPPLPPESGARGYRLAAGANWWRHGLFLVGMPVELRESITVKKPYLTYGLSLVILLCTCPFWADERLWMPLVFNPTAQGLDYLTGAFGYALLHGDVLHLIGNLYFLLIFGNNVECHFGRRRMLGLFFAASLCGAMLHGLAGPTPLIGASGGVFGILVFYALQFPHARILWLPFGWMVNVAMLVFGRPLLARGISVRIYLAGYLVIQFLLLYDQLFLSGNISALAHLGGGFAGALVWWAWRKKWLP
jgi:membrane associated rhomboid family serine protease